MNQCNGCRAGMLLRDGHHYNKITGRVEMGCTKDRYEESKMKEVDGIKYEKGPGTGDAIRVGETHRGTHEIPLGLSGYKANVEVFYCPTDYRLTTEEGDALEPGWYWWPCSAGCLPDAEPLGAFTTSKAAYDDAVQEYT